MSKRAKFNLRTLFLWVALFASLCSWFGFENVRHGAASKLCDVDSTVRWWYVENQLNEILGDVNGREFRRDGIGVHFNLYGSDVTDTSLLKMARLIRWLPKGERDRPYFFYLYGTEISADALKEAQEILPNAWFYRG